MKAAAIGIEVFDELFGRHAGVEQALVTKVTIPKFVDCVVDELGGGPFGGFKGCVIQDEDSMFRFAPCLDDRCGIVGNDGVNVKRYLKNYRHLSDYGQTIFCLSFPSRDRATAPWRYEHFYL